MNKLNNRDIRIELLRIFACFSVVLIHCYEPYLINNHISKQMLILYAIVGCANTIFFFITGCFWYNSCLDIYDFLKVLKRFLLNVFLPTLLFSILFAILDPFVYGYQGSVLNYFNGLDFKMIAYGIIHRNFNAISGASLPYWYIFEFARLLLFYPLIAFLINKKQNKLIILLIIIGFVRSLINDLSVLPQLNYLENFLFPYFPNSLIFTLLGYIFYNNKEKILNKINNYLGFILVVLSLFLQLVLEMIALRIDININRFFYWDSFISYIMVIGLFLFVYSLKESFINRFNTIINFIAKRSFYIFLLHFGVYTKLLTSGFIDVLKNTISNPLLLSIIKSFIVFIISLIISSLIISIKKYLDSKFIFVNK